MPALQGGHLHVCDKTPWYRRAWFKTTDGSPSVAGIHRQRRRCIPGLTRSGLPRAASSDQRTMCTRITTRYETSTGSRLVPHGKHNAHARAVLMATRNA